jgi:ribosome biogenesis SPOUT family RNA methylase Rps3
VTAKIEIQDYIENEDGSARIVFDCDDEARKSLIAEGLISIIEKAVSEHEEDYNWKKGDIEIG